MILKTFALTASLTIAATIAATIATPATAQAAQAATPTPNRAQTSAPTRTVDDRPLVEYLLDFVYAIDRPIFVYNWFNSIGHDPIWKQKLQSDDSAGYAHFKTMSKAYWSSFCSKDDSVNPKDCPSAANLAAQMSFGSGNMFGPGLYAAVDPVATANYGGGDLNWVLMQMRLPQGFRIMDLRRDGAGALPLKVQRILTSYSCPASWDDMQNGLNTLLSANNIYLTGSSQYNYNGANPSVSLTPQCLIEIRKVLKDNLKIDGFFYSYQATDFKVCDAPLPAGSTGSSPNPFRQGAFVIANSNSLNASDVRVFNRQTTDDLEDRVRIQSLFYQADVDSPSNSLGKFFANQTFPNYPGYRYSGTTQSCSSIGSSNGSTTTCTTQIYICPTAGGSCQVITPANMPTTPLMPTVMSNSNVPASQGGQSYNANSTFVQSLVWPDMDGVAPDAQALPWVQKNLFGCQLTREYQATDE